MAVSGIHHATLIVTDEQRASWFYGQVLGLDLKPRPGFKFPGLFYHCGDQELHLIVAAKPLTSEDLFIRVNDISSITRRFIHRHVALIVSNLDNMKQRLKDNHIEILFDADQMRNDPDPLISNVIDGWNKMYGSPPLFCEDPFGNLLEIIPGRPKKS